MRASREPTSPPAIFLSVRRSRTLGRFVAMLAVLCGAVAVLALHLTGLIR